MDFLRSYWKQRRGVIGAFFLFGLIFLVVFALFHLPVKAVAYPALLCALLGCVFLGIDMARAYRKHRLLQENLKLTAPLMECFPEPETLEDQDYQRIIQLLRHQQAESETLASERYVDMVEYYTAWAHQIKTPIASMRLSLQNEDSDLSRRLSEELQRIEQYVEMVLVFFRLDGHASDYVIGEYALDPIVRSSVKKFAGQFIRRKIKLEYTPLEVSVLTDEKWLSFVIEQVLSNALKYTPAGTVRVFLEEPKTLCIADTGIGIAPEDLPRIFEKGYTGFNGRTDKKASGIGLYLCRRICANLGHRITAESIPGKGTVIRIELQEQKLEIE